MAEYRGKHHSGSESDQGSEPTRRDRTRQSVNSTPAGNQPRRSYSGKRSRSAHRQAARQFSSYDTSAIRTRRMSPVATVASIVVALVILAGLVFGGIKLYEYFSAGQAQDVEPGQTVTVTIEEGSSTSVIASALKKAGVISDETSFKNAVASREVDNALKPGEYQLVTGMDMDALIDKLVAGPVEMVEGNRLTIPEGLTIEQTAQTVEQATGISASEFTDLAHSADLFIDEYPFLEGAYDNSLEGFLYPKTYVIPYQATAADVITTLLDQFQIETASLDFSYATEHNLTLFDVVTIASLIERETRLDEERPLIASVVYNRLHDGMRLQIDATVLYALGNPADKQYLYNDDLLVDSPYNTYAIDGLPAGPICSPRLASIDAAAHPSDTSFLYYVITSEEGTHTFCETEDEFYAAKAQYQSLLEQ